MDKETLGKLLEWALERGNSITYSELNDWLPEKISTKAEIEGIVEFLNDNDISLREGS